MTALPVVTPGVPAPSWSTTEWIHSDPLDVADLRGRVVVLEAFQMLCPGCVNHGLPQMKRVIETFGDDVTVVGLHTVFEHHDAMAPASLRAFVYQFGIRFPVGMDVHESAGSEPVTFTRYGMRGTPSTILIDRDGHVRAHALGAVGDLALGAAIGRLVSETA